MTDNEFLDLPIDERLAHMRRENAIQFLSVFVTHANLATYRCTEEDEGEAPGSFADYGTDPETVRIIMNDLLPEVIERVIRLQRAVTEEIVR